MTTEEAVLRLREDPRFAELVRDAYLGPDTRGNAERFLASGEFTATLEVLGARVRGGAVLDVGAGTGIASYAFARSGAREVVALEPDPSDVVGRGAIRQIADGLPIAVEAAFGEALPFPEGRFDVVYARQVLHHACDLDALVRECARVASPSGIVIAAREHVVDDEAQLREFLATHPVHQLAGGENAFRLAEYVRAFRRAGLTPAVLGPFDSVINAFPTCRDEAALRAFPAGLLREHYGRIGELTALVPGVAGLVSRRIVSAVPGRLYSFIASKRAR